jgi:hypothetical protein
MTFVTSVPDHEAMRKLYARVTDTRTLAAGAILTTAWLALAGSTFGGWGMALGAASGITPWLCLYVLRPRVLFARVLATGERVGVSVASLVGVVGVVWVAAATVQASRTNDARTIAVAAAVAVALAFGVGLASARAEWLPFAFTATVVAAGLVILGLVSAWAGACPSCYVHEYHDPPTRSFMFSVWALAGGTLLSCYAGMIVLGAYTSRFAKPRPG